METFSFNVERISEIGEGVVAEYLVGSLILEKVMLDAEA